MKASSKMATENVNQDVRIECDTLTRKVSQLEGLLHATYGGAFDGFDNMADEFRDAFLWGCADLAGECHRLATSISSHVYKNLATQPSEAQP